MTDLDHQRPCETCGKPHELRERADTKPGEYGKTWADPDDGHPYRPWSWERIGAELIDRYKVDLRKLAES